MTDNHSPARKHPGPRGGTRADLLEVAASLFETQGYKGTSIRDIARATDTSISNIYHHFGNKEGLWRAIHKSSVHNLPAQLRAAMAGETDPVRRFEKLLRAHLAEAEAYRREARIFFINADQLESRRNKANTAVQRAVLDIYVGELAGLRKRGHIRSSHLKVVAFNVLGVVNWMLRWFRQDGPLPAADVHEEIIDFVMHGVGIRR
jgi:AcrR family transcriptional regulator